VSRRPAYHAGSTARQIRNSDESALVGPEQPLARDPGDSEPRDAEPRDRVLLGLLVLALISRFGWALWVHPPQDHVFSDMAHYVHRARLLVSGAIGPGDRMMAWQAWGTHALLAVPMLLLGPKAAALELAGLMWAGFSTATVVLSYRLAARVLPAGSSGRGRNWPAAAVGVIALLWFPLLSHTGYFVSETPYACVLLATTLAIVTLIQTGSGAVRAGLFGAIAFALRPQVAVFFALLGLAWLLDRRRRSWSARVDLRAVAGFVVPLVLILAVSLIRVRVYAGEFAGVAENATMNLTAGRCHNIVTRAYPSAEAMARGQRPSRRVSLPGFRALAQRGPDHPLALDPALGGESIDFVGYIGDRSAHRAIRARCYAATGVLGQLRYSVTNVALAWVVARPWPESSDRGAPELLSVAVRGRMLAAALAPLALLGLGLALGRWAPWRWRPRSDADEQAGDASEAGRVAGLGVCGLQLLSLLLTSALFFATPRLRTPYDPYAMILAVALLLAVGGWLSRRSRGHGLPSAPRASP
jgi:hypothetical protein